ncbi:MAG: ATP-dependent helicase [Lacrimispora sp.]|uniref:ATP-dependent helicase n=1 Tax=Lacrimispora sp. TaxID=2719234 RepID=UPI0039E58B99
MKYENEFSRLNEYQREAVLDESEACVVNANVGSGKTTVLIAKIIYLHYEKRVPYKNMVVLTFTNKAANEIKERLFQLDSEIPQEELLGFGTFHSVALNLLKNGLPLEKMGYTRDFAVIEPDEELDIAMQVIQEHHLTIKYKNRLKKRLEQEMMSAQEGRQTSKYNDDILTLVSLLTEEKKKQNKMTFFDLLHVSNALLADYSAEPEWIIIDEVQDSDKIQLEFIDKLKGRETKLFAVGDPNQVIYSWRGSSINVFYSLKRKYSAKEFTLPINYRSSASILGAARCFLENGSQLSGIRDQGSKIVIKNHYNPFNEAEYLAERLQDLHNKGAEYREMAVFYRLQNQSHTFEAVFTKKGIPYEVSLKKTIRDIPVLNWLIKVLRFSVNQEDLSSALYVLKDRFYGEGLSDSMANKAVKQGMVSESRLLELMLQFKESCAGIGTGEDLYEYFNLDRYIRPTSASYGEDKEAVDALLDIIVDYIAEKQMDFVAGLADFINSSALYGVNILQKDINNQADSVKLMTLHASKGLEFKYVFIVGINYGLIPLQTRGFEEEEERRLFFVGITRAKDYLELSYYTNPESYKAMPGASRYIDMIPRQFVREGMEGAEEISLQDLRKQVEAAKRESQEEAAVTVLKVKHEKYGLGTVVSEDDDMILVDFESYGQKEFIKAFSELSYV